PPPSGPKRAWLPDAPVTSSVPKTSRPELPDPKRSSAPAGTVRVEHEQTPSPTMSYGWALLSVTSCWMVPVVINSALALALPQQVNRPPLPLLFAVEFVKTVLVPSVPIPAP